MDSQTIVNFSFALVSFLGGWVMKMVWSRITSVDDDLEDLQKHHESDLKEVRKELNEIALAMPEKYVAKQDLDKLIDYFNGRFDKLEHKLDELKK